MPLKRQKKLAILPQMKIAKTFFTSINFKDKTFNLSLLKRNSIPKSLSDSIDRVGILHPPIIKKIDKDNFIIANGRKRLSYAKNKLKLTSCKCLIIPQITPTLKAWEIVLEEILLERPLSLIEQAEFFNKILQLIPIEKAAEQFLPMLDLKPQAYHIKQLLPLTELEGPIKIALQNGSLNPKAAFKLATLSFRDRLALFDMISSLHLSVGNQNKFISTCKELEKRSGKSILAILTEPAVSEIINSEANTPQKAGNLMRYLAERLSPRLTEAEKDFKAFVNKLKLPENTSLSHTQAFENDALAFGINFKNKKKFLDFWQKYQAIISSG